MKNYETVFILNPALSEEQVQNSVDKYEKYLKSNGAKIISKEIPAEIIYEDDNIANRIMHYFAEHKDPETLTMTKEIIDQLLNTPSLLDKYPTVVSGFIQDLNLSPLSLEYKTQIQNISELLGFNVAHSNSSWHRNRPGFLISLYGTLRWHGSRLPNCNGFLQDIVGRFPPIVALSHIANLFTQQILNAKSNPKKTINT